jgi:hypothetical protein
MTQWCQENYINFRAMKTARKVRSCSSSSVSSSLFLTFLSHLISLFSTCNRKVREHLQADSHVKRLERDNEQHPSSSSSKQSQLQLGHTASLDRRISNAVSGRMCPVPCEVLMCCCVLFVVL